MERFGASAWVQLVLPIVVVQLVGPPLFAWLLRRRGAQGERRTGTTVMRYPPAWIITLGVALVVIWAFVGYAIVASPPRPAETRVSDMMILVGAPLLLTLIVSAYMLLLSRVAHEVGPEGFLVVEPLRRRRLLRWAEITEVYFDAGMSWWRLRTAPDSFWVAQALSGLGAFARAILDNVPAHVIDARPSTRSQLESAANGADARQA